MDAANKRTSQQDKKQVQSEHEQALQDDITLLHDEMNTIFGEKPEEYLSDNNSTSTSSSSTSSAIREEKHAALQGRKAATTYRYPQSGPQKINLYDDLSTNVSNTVDVINSKTLLIQGPCLYLRQQMIGTTLSRDQVISHAQQVSSSFGIDLECVVSNHEGQVIDTLLNQDIKAAILHLNGSIRNHPNLLQALTIIDYPIVLVSSNREADHGTLPPSVIAVFPGYQAQNTYRLALQNIAFFSDNPLSTK